MLAHQAVQRKFGKNLCNLLSSGLPNGNGRTLLMIPVKTGQLQRSAPCQHEQFILLRENQVLTYPTTSLKIHISQCGRSMTNFPINEDRHKKCKALRPRQLADSKPSSRRERKQGVWRISSLGQVTSRLNIAILNTRTLTSPINYKNGGTIHANKMGLNGFESRERTTKNYYILSPIVSLYLYKQHKQWRCRLPDT